MSDIALNFGGPLGLALIALMFCWPGLLLGAIIGALAWRRHRRLGSALGAIVGLALWAGSWFYLKEFM
jgi:Na+/proline symporter